MLGAVDGSSALRSRSFLDRAQIAEDRADLVDLEHEFGHVRMTD